MVMNRRARGGNVPSLVRKYILELERAGNPSDAEKARYYFKADEDVGFFGLKSPRVKEIEMSLFQEVRGQWGYGEALQFCELMLRRRELEAKSVGILLLGRYRKEFDTGLIERIEEWLGSGMCANWATTDVLCSLVSSPLIERHPDLLPRIGQWIERDSLWLRRASLVTLVPHARRGTHLDFAYLLAEKSFHYPEDLMHKATGWLLREAGKTDPARLEAFLLRHGPRIPRTTVRYAIEKFPPANRRKLLEITRAGA